MSGSRDQGPFSLRVESFAAGVRLDTFLGTHLPQCSRSHATQLIRRGHIRVNAALKKPSYRIRTGDRIEGELPPPERVCIDPQPMPLHILYEDHTIIVINKSPSLVVHPAPGHHSDTLVNGLLHHCVDLAPIVGKIRPGIVHRLDKDTSGTIIVAKNATALQNLTGQFKARTVAKTYLALVYGTMPGKNGQIDLPIGRHPTERKRMSVHSRRPREALTLWQVQADYDSCSLLEVAIKTGRTHQIRVHVAAIQHPVIGDALYGGRVGGQYQRQNPRLKRLVSRVERQLLHAWRLTVGPSRDR